MRRRRGRTLSHDRIVRDLVAVVLLALAVFLVFVLYLGWEGGLAGRWATTALRSAVGLLAFIVPALLVYVAVLLVSPEDRRPATPVTAGVALLCTAFALAAAAGSFGAFGDPRADTRFLPSYMGHHGGALGELLFVPLHPVLGGLGIDILVLALVAVGVLLVSGSSLGLWAHHSARGARVASRAARRSAQTLAERREAASVFRHGQEETAVARVAQPLAATGGRAAAPAHGPLADEPTIAAPRPRPLHLVDGQRDLPDLFGEPHDGPDDVVARVTGEGIDTGDEADQLTLADEAEAADDHETALAFVPAGGLERQWTLPDARFLQRLGDGQGETQATIAAVSEALIETLGHFGVEAWVVDTISGPRVTRYELQLAPGTKVSRVASLKDDIAYALAATEIRIQAPIPGKSAVGVEVPNRQPNFVALGDIWSEFPVGASPLAFWLGKDITGRAVLADLTRLVHVLIAGTTGSGKSQCINAIVSSILLRATPDDVRLILIDPKKVELSHFDGIPHLLAPVVTSHKAASAVLQNVVHEMERRYESMLRTDNAQNIRELNKKLRRLGEPPLPYVVVVVDELADLMMVAPAEVEHAIIRLGQLGRAVGIHMLVATQRPSVDVVTGLIKTNVPSRIAFAVSSQTDSRVILDTGGAESLLGEGDMLFHPYTSAKMMRVQGAMVTPEEMKLVTEHWRTQAAPEFNEELLEGATADAGERGSAPDEDELLPQAMETVVHTGAASVALLQRRLRIGYARAGRLIDIMEGMGIISGYDGSKARNVLIDQDGLSRYLPADGPARATTATMSAAAAGDDFAGE